MNDNTDALPPLPLSPAEVCDLILETREHVQALGWGNREQLYTASQVRAYARAALAAQQGAQVPQPDLVRHADEALRQIQHLLADLVTAEDDNGLTRYVPKQGLMFSNMVSALLTLAPKLEAALSASPQAPAQPTAESLLRDELPHAEWEGKHIHPVGAESFQCWRICIRLPVPLSEIDKSPEAALNRLLKGKP